MIPVSGESTTFRAALLGWDLCWRWGWGWCDSKMKEGGVWVRNTQAKPRLGAKGDRRERRKQQWVLPDSQTRDQSSKASHTTMCLSPVLLLGEFSSGCNHRQTWVVTVSLQSQTLAVEWAPHISNGASWTPQSCRVHISPGLCRHIPLGYVPRSRVTTHRRDASSSLLHNVKLVFQISCMNLHPPASSTCEFCSTFSPLQQVLE